MVDHFQRFGEILLWGEHRNRPAGHALRKDLNGELMNQTPDRARSLGTSSTTELHSLCNVLIDLTPNCLRCFSQLVRIALLEPRGCTGLRRKELSKVSLICLCQQVGVIMISWTKGFQGACNTSINRERQGFKHFVKLNFVSQTLGWKLESSSHSLQHGTGISQTSGFLLITRVMKISYNH